MLLCSKKELEGRKTGSCRSAANSDQGKGSQAVGSSSRSGNRLTVGEKDILKVKEHLGLIIWVGKATEAPVRVLVFCLR